MIDKCWAILDDGHSPSSLSLRVMPMGSSVFLWNCTNLTRVTFSTWNTGLSQRQRNWITGFDKDELDCFQYAINNNFTAWGLILYVGNIIFMKTQIFATNCLLANWLNSIYRGGFSYRRTLAVGPLHLVPRHVDQVDGGAGGRHPERVLAVNLVSDHVMGLEQRPHTRTPEDLPHLETERLVRSNEKYHTVKLVRINERYHTVKLERSNERGIILSM